MGKIEKNIIMISIALICLLCIGAVSAAEDVAADDLAAVDGEDIGSIDEDMSENDDLSLEAADDSGDESGDVCGELPGGAHRHVPVPAGVLCRPVRRYRPLPPMGGRGNRIPFPHHASGTGTGVQRSAHVHLHR